MLRSYDASENGATDFITRIMVAERCHLAIHGSYAGRPGAATEVLTLRRQLEASAAGAAAAAVPVPGTSDADRRHESIIDTDLEPNRQLQW